MLMIPLLVVLALAPIAAIVWYVYAKDKHEKEPTKLLFYCFALGIVSIIPALLGSELGISLGLDESPNMFMTFLFAFFVVALSEEGAKFLFLRFYIFPKKEFNEPYDGIIYAVMIGMGFAAFENLLYVVQGGWEIGLLRMFTAVPAHAVFGGLMGYYVGLAKMSPNYQYRTLQLAKGLGIAVTLHGLYDFFLFQQNFELLAFMSFILLFASIRYTQKAIAMHQEISPFSAQNLALQTQDTPTDEQLLPTQAPDLTKDDEQVII